MLDNKSFQIIVEICTQQQQQQQKERSNFQVRLFNIYIQLKLLPSV